MNLGKNLDREFWESLSISLRNFLYGSIGRFLYDSLRNSLWGYTWDFLIDSLFNSLRLALGWYLRRSLRGKQ